MPLLDVDADTLHLNFHAGQWEAWESTKRIVLILAGARGGKTSFGPPWLHREMITKGPGDYLIAGPDYPLLEKAAGPEVKHYFQTLLGLGKLSSGKGVSFTFSPEGCKRLWGYVPDREPRIIFCHADNPDSLQAMTAKAAWLDEAGQAKFKLDSWLAVNLRLAIDQGRCLLTTTPYVGLGWIKSKLYDPWEKAKRNHPDIDVVQFRSTMNPAFPREEYDKAQREWPPWKFRLFYNGELTKPAGMIYDCFTEKNECPRSTLPASWPRYLGLDFGGVHTAGVFLAEEQMDGKATGRYFAYREYPAPEESWHQRTAAEHASALLQGEPCIPFCVGGSRSEGQWRKEFAAAGLPVREPKVSDVEVGINRTYSLIKSGGLIMFEDLARSLDGIKSYAREVDDLGETTEKIADKADAHFCDALRYIAGWLRTDQKELRVW